MSDRSFFKRAKYNKTIEITEEELDRLKGILRGILEDVILVADKYKLRYVLCGGSCLGAVRHQGFIPWDDDIDLMLPRKDYDMFIRIFDKEMGDKYVLCAPSRGRGHGMSHTQVKLKGTVYQSFNELSKKNEDDKGIFVDIFVMENTFDSNVFRKLHGVLCLAAGYMLTCRKTYEDFPGLKPYIRGNRELYKNFSKKAIIGRLFKRISLDTMARITDRIYSLSPNDKSRLITIPSGRGHYFTETYERKMVTERRLVKFENIGAYIPKGYKDYLSRLYGEDYMILPSEEKKESHPIMKLEFGKYK